MSTQIKSETLFGRAAAQAHKRINPLTKRLSLERDDEGTAIHITGFEKCHHYDPIMDASIQEALSKLGRDEHDQQISFAQSAELTQPFIVYSADPATEVNAYVYGVQVDGVLHVLLVTAVNVETHSSGYVEIEVQGIDSSCDTPAFGKSVAQAVKTAITRFNREGGFLDDGDHEAAEELLREKVDLEKRLAEIESGEESDEEEDSDDEDVDGDGDGEVYESQSYEAEPDDDAASGVEDASETGEDEDIDEDWEMTGEQVAEKDPEQQPELDWYQKLTQELERQMFSYEDDELLSDIVEPPISSSHKRKADERPLDSRPRKAAKSLVSKGDAYATPPASDSSSPVTRYEDVLAPFLEAERLSAPTDLSADAQRKRAIFQLHVYQKRREGERNGQKQEVQEQPKESEDEEDYLAPLQRKGQPENALRYIMSGQTKHIVPFNSEMVQRNQDRTIDKLTTYQLSAWLQVQGQNSAGTLNQMVRWIEDYVKHHTDDDGVCKLGPHYEPTDKEAVKRKQRVNANMGRPAGSGAATKSGQATVSTTGAPESAKSNGNTKGEDPNAPHTLGEIAELIGTDKLDKLHMKKLKVFLRKVLEDKDFPYNSSKAQYVARIKTNYYVEQAVSFANYCHNMEHVDYRWVRGELGCGGLPPFHSHVPFQSVLEPLNNKPTARQTHMAVILIEEMSGALTGRTVQPLRSLAAQRGYSISLPPPAPPEVIILDDD